MKLLIAILSLLFAATSMAAIAPNGSYVLDRDHANVGFSVSHLGISNVVGRFNTINGSMTFEANGNSKVEFTIDSESVDTNQPRRDKHIRSEDFFDVESYPKITFNSTKLTYTEDGDPKTITGDLSLHGEKLPVTFDVSVVGSGEFPQGTQRAGYMATAKINRGDFGIDSFKGVVGEEISITVNLEIIKQ